jgi:hypothetical protein
VDAFSSTTLESITIMPPADDWSGDERRQERRRNLERRKEARKDDLDRMIEKSKVGKTQDAKERGADRRKNDRRESQICFVCRDAFVPEASGQTVCAKCRIDGVRGGGRHGWRAPRF